VKKKSKVRNSVNAYDYNNPGRVGQPSVRWNYTTSMQTFVRFEDGKPIVYTKGSRLA
jgi:hypothetical protein